MIANRINTNSSQKIEFKTHSFYFDKIGPFLSGYIVVNMSIYTEMQLSSRIFIGNTGFKGHNLHVLAEMLAQQYHIYPNPEYVFKTTPIENERYLIYRFLKSIFLGDERNLILFSDDDEYKLFCTNNNIEYTEQEWFKRFYINDDYTKALNYITQKSLEFQTLYFPESSAYSRVMPSLHEAKLLRETVQYKVDFNEIYEILKQHNITCLYHFTDYSNIASIIHSGAIYSQKELLNRRINPHYASSADSRDADKHRGSDNYVRLSFARTHPMMYTALTSGRISKPVILEINPLIALMPNVLFSDQNALKSTAQIGQSHNNLRNIHFDIIRRGNYLNMSPEDRNYYQAEVLVPQRIGTEMLLNLKEII